ncbi:MAG: vWA domain-containing protein [bacterium]
MNSLYALSPSQASSQSSKKRTDDWKYKPGSSSSSSSGGVYYPAGGLYGAYTYGGGYGGTYAGYTMAAAAPLYSYSSYNTAGASSYSATASSNIGYSTGGAKDVNNFRQNIENDYLPIPTDITYEGLFYDYYFNTGEPEECSELFCPLYTSVVTKEPFSAEDEYFLSVGLNSGITKEDFRRKKLNLVIVLDISGSMGSAFNRYYYDRFGNRQSIEAEDSGKKKLTIATEAIVALLDHLRDDDRFGMVLFESTAHLAKPLRLVGETDMEAIKDHILTLRETGGTNMEAGMREGTELFDEFLSIDHSVYENRIIFLTDAMPNTGVTSDTGLLGMTRENASTKIFSTFIGIGVDFNTELVEFITKIQGANYYSVHSSAQFIDRMDEGFEYMVTPLVFDLTLTMEAQGFEIQKVYGSPEADEATGEIMKVNTLFPSDRTGEGIKGGIILLQLTRLSDDASIRLTVSYEDREGNFHENWQDIGFDYQEPDDFPNTGIRKAVLLSRYASLMKNWIMDERKSLNENEPAGHTIVYDYGIPYVRIPCLYPKCPWWPPTCPILYQVELGQWERQSVALQVSEEYRQLFVEFKEYFESEMAAIGDDTLEQEVTILETLSTYSAY